MGKKLLLKKSIALLLSVSMILGSGVAGIGTEGVYADNAVSGSKGTHWADGTMTKLNEKGLLKGDERGFRPDENITRAEFIAFVNRFMDYKEAGDVSAYKDVNPKAWYAKEIAIGVKAGYINGTSKDTMSPESPITNEQMFTILSKLSKASGEMDLSAVKDKGEISSWAKSGIAIAIANGYVTGYQGKINPKKAATRAQAMTVLDRVKENKRVIAFPGVYKIEEASEITVLCDGVELIDSKIKGDLILKGEAASIYTKNVKVEGKVLKEVGGKLEEKSLKDLLPKNKDGSKKLKDGTYEGMGKGYGGDMKLRVVIKDGKISELKILSHNETPSYITMVEGFMKKIVEQGNIENIDAVTGATKTSDAIFNAIKDVYSQASGETAKPGESKESQSSSGGGGGGGILGEVPTGRVEGIFLDGSYDATATGYRGTLKVKIQVAGGILKSVEILEHKEDRQYFSKANEEELLKRIASRGNVDREDVVSGATVSSDAVLAAVEKALKKAVDPKFKDDDTGVAKEYASGRWYGLGRGYYRYDKIGYDHAAQKQTRTTPTEVAVDINNDGKVTGVSLVHFGDDDSFERPRAYEIINAEVIKNNGVSGLRSRLSKKDKNDPLIEAVTGATYSARGYIEAVNHALERSAKYKKDGVDQKIRSISMKDFYDAKLTYGETRDISNEKIVITYLDDSVKTVALKDIAAEGIEINLPLELKIDPDDPARYDKNKDVVLILEHKPSMIKYHMGLVASRHLVQKVYDKIKIKVAGRTQPYTVQLDDNNFSYTCNIDMPSVSAVEWIKVLDKAGHVVPVDNTKTQYDQGPAILRFSLADMPKAPDHEKTAYEHKYQNYVVDFVNNIPFNINDIVSFDISNDAVGVKRDYKKGERLDLSNLHIYVRDKNSKDRILSHDQLEANGFTVSLAEPHGNIVKDNVGFDYTFDEAGTFDLVIKHNKLPEKEDERMFISIKDDSSVGAGEPAYFELYIDGENVKTVNLEPGKKDYTIDLGMDIDDEGAEVSIMLFDKAGDEMDSAASTNYDGSLGGENKFRPDDEVKKFFIYKKASDSDYFLSFLITP